MAQVEFGNLLRFYRRRAGLTQQQLARMADYSPSAWARFESGARTPRDPVGVVRALEAVAGVNSLESARCLDALKVGGVGPSDAVIDLLAARLDAVEARLDFGDRPDDELMDRTPEMEAYASLLTRSAYWRELGVMRPEKDMIAKYALRLIHTGDVIALDSGTTTAAVARTLASANRFRRNRVLTNNLFIALFLMSNHFDVELLCDSLRLTDELLHYGAILGPGAHQKLRNLSGQMNVAFLSTTHLSYEEGPFASSELQREFKRDLVRYADRVVILADSSKFRQRPPEGQEPVFSAVQWVGLLKSKVQVVTALSQSAARDPELASSFQEARRTFGERLLVARRIEELADLPI